jgi:molybdopterin-guanine dinucleotide biosynthesis protein A
MGDGSSQQQRLSAVVLAGGMSRRMGRDKALETIAGRTLLARAVDAVLEVTGDVSIVGHRDAYLRYGVPVIADDYPGTGPLGGIATALRHARQEFVLVVACDLPLLSVPLLRAMAAQPRGYDVLLPVTAAVARQQGGAVTRQTLHAIYRRTCLARFDDCLKRGERQVVSALDGLNVHELPESWLREYDPNLRSLLNTNRPADLIEARKLAGEHGFDQEGSG